MLKDFVSRLIFTKESTIEQSLLNLSITDQLELPDSILYELLKDKSLSSSPYGLEITKLRGILSDLISKKMDCQ